MKNKPTIPYKDFVELFEYKYKQTTLRRGQTLMIVLNYVWRDEYKRISSVHYYVTTDIYFYYNDKLIEYTLDQFETIWNYGR